MLVGKLDTSCTSENRSKTGGKFTQSGNATSSLVYGNGYAS